MVSKALGTGNENSTGNAQSIAVADTTLSFESPVKEKEVKKSGLETIRQKELASDTNEFKGGKKGGNAEFIMLNDPSNNPFLDQKVMDGIVDITEKLCTLTASECKGGACAMAPIKVKDVFGEIANDEDRLGRFLSRNDKMNKFNKYVVGKYFSSLTVDERITLVNKAKSNKRGQNKAISNTFATELKKKICLKETTGSFMNTLTTSSANINTLEYLFMDDVTKYEQTRTAPPLRKPLYRVAKNARTQITANTLKLDTVWLHLYAGLNIACFFGYNIFDLKGDNNDNDDDLFKLIKKNIRLMMGELGIKNLDNHILIAKLNGNQNVADSLEDLGLELGQKVDDNKQVPSELERTTAVKLNTLFEGDDAGMKSKFNKIKGEYIQQIQEQIQKQIKGKNDNDNDKKFLEKFTQQADNINPIYQKVLDDYFYKRNIFNNAVEYFKILYTRSSVIGIKLLLDGVENQVVRKYTSSNTYFSYISEAQAVNVKPKNTDNDNNNAPYAMKQKEAEIYFYDEIDKKTILDMMEKIDIRKLNNELKGDNKSTEGINELLEYFNIFASAKAGTIPWLGKVYNRLRAQFKNLIEI